MFEGLLLAGFCQLPRGPLWVITGCSGHRWR